MAEFSGFFDAHLVNGEYDRVYLAEHFAKYFASFISDGIFAGKSNELMVKQQDSPNMSVKVLAGKGWIGGYIYENDDELTLPFDVADGVLNRIDSVVLRWNNSERVIRLAVKKGISATKPVAVELQRDDDIYELKLAEIYIKAGVTSITQVNITDTRLNYEVCGLVHNAVDGLETSEFGRQLNDYIDNFIKESDEWFTTFASESNNKVDNLISANQTKINTLLSTGRSDIDAAINDGNARVSKLITDYDAEWAQSIAEYEQIKTNGQAEIERLIAELEEIALDNDAVLLYTKVEEVTARVTLLETEITAIQTNIQSNSSAIATIRNEINIINGQIREITTNVTTLQGDINKFKALFTESGPGSGCYYRIVNNENEWINPPNEVGVVYRTTERWNGQPVYQQIIYVGALPNKTVMGIAADASWNKIISVDGFALGDDDMYYYPFPVIINGLTPAAVITNVEGDGGNGGTIVIQTNEDLSYLKAYIKIKYTK